MDHILITKIHFFKYPIKFALKVILSGVFFKMDFGNYDMEIFITMKIQRFETLTLASYNFEKFS